MSWQWLAALISEAVQFLIQVIFAQLRGLGDSTLTALLVGVHALIPSVSLTGWTGYIANLNYVFPFSEMMGFVTLYLTLWSMVWAYRAIKSWIPTVSGS